MKMCSKCGASVAAENKFCTMCGCLIEDNIVSNETVNQSAPVQNNMGMDQMNNQMPNNSYNPYMNQPVNGGYNQYNSYMNQPVNNVPQGPKTNGLAIAGFICSIVGALCCFIPIIGVVGLILSIVGLNKIKTSGEKGKGLAIAGIVLGAIAIVLYVLIILLGVLGEVSTYSSF